MYRNLKPTEGTNAITTAPESALITGTSNTPYDGTGSLISTQRYDLSVLNSAVYSNVSGVPIFPSVTSSTIFQGEGSQEGFTTAVYYWSSSMPGGSTINRINGFAFSFLNGGFTGSTGTTPNVALTTTLRRVRAIRREVIGTL
jgi:hypothetical protein